MVALTLLTLPLSQLENLTRWKPTSTVLSMAIGGHGYGGHGHGGHGHGGPTQRNATQPLPLLDTVDNWTWI